MSFRGSSNALAAILGSGLLLSVLLVVGIITFLNGNVDQNLASLTGSTTSTSTSMVANNFGSAALRATCISDARTLQAAIGAYEAQNSSITVESGISPGTPSTYQQGREANKLVANHFLATWPDDSHGFAISLSSTIAGSISIYVPASSATSVNFEFETSSNGCNSL